MVRVAVAFAAAIRRIARRENGSLGLEAARVGHVLETATVAALALHILITRILRGRIGYQRLARRNVAVTADRVTVAAVISSVVAGLKRGSCIRVLGFLPLDLLAGVAVTAGRLLLLDVAVTEEPNCVGGRIFEQGLVPIHDLFIDAPEQGDREQSGTESSVLPYACHYSNLNPWSGSLRARPSARARQ